MLRPAIILALAAILTVGAASAAITVTDSENGTYAVVTFSGTGSTTWEVPEGVSSLSVLVVAGGGGGGGAKSASYVGGGGGGAGGVNYTASYTVTPESEISITIGAGGGGGAIGSKGTNGGNSSFGSVTAVGGGGGGCYAVSPYSGTSGGSGGGAAYSGTPGSGSSGQGNAGGNGYSGAGLGGGGGGGAGSSGESGGTGDTNGGDGGSGVTYLSLTLGGGGGGGARSNYAGGLGTAGGGRGGGSTSDPVQGTDGTGGGGGGGRGHYSASAGADGGDGIIRVEYLALVTPVAAFSANATNGYSPLTIEFTDESSNYPDNWAWDLDNDGMTETTDQNPIYTYSSLGSYTVKLVASNDAGSDSETKYSYITVFSSSPATSVPTTAITATRTTATQEDINEVLAHVQLITPNLLNIVIASVPGFFLIAIVGVVVMFFGNLKGVLFRLLRRRKW